MMYFPLATAGCGNIKGDSRVPQLPKTAASGRVSLAHIPVFAQNYQGIQPEYLSKIADFMSGLIDRIAAQNIVMKFL